MSPEMLTNERGDSSLSRLARLVLAAFVLTFISARVVVLLIMAHWLPDLYLFIRGTHVHHLNYGIFLLAGVGAWLLFGRPAGRALTLAAVLYGVGLALTFDEFGMWLHLGGPYWQRASFDAVVVIAALLGLAAAAPTLRQFERRHWITLFVVLLAGLLFAGLLAHSLGHAGHALRLRLEYMEDLAPG